MAGLTSQEKKALRLFAERVRRAFPDQRPSLELCASKARGEATKFCDVNALVILPQATWQDRRTVSYVTAEVLLETGVVISTKTFSREQFRELQESRSMFWQAIQP